MEKDKSGGKTLFNSKKDDHYYFDFFKSNKIGDSQIINDLIGLPKMPLIGRYSRNGYEIDKIRGVLIANCELNKKNWILETDYNENKNKICLPFGVIDLVVNIPKSIKHNKGKSDEEKKNNFKFNKNKNERKFEIFDFHPFPYKSLNKIKFIWSISFNIDPKLEQNLEKELYGNYNKHKKKKKFNEPENFKNLITHAYVFENLNFAFQKKLIHNIPCCISIPEEIEKSSGIEFYDKNSFKSINFNELRSEYLSVHSKFDSLCFSPNNMRFIVNQKYIISHFYSVFLGEIDQHLIVYHWVINDFHDIFEDVLKNSKNVGEFLDNSQNFIGENDAIKHAKKIFLH